MGDILISQNHKPRLHEPYPSVQKLLGSMSRVTLSSYGRKSSCLNVHWKSRSIGFLKVGAISTGTTEVSVNSLSNKIGTVIIPCGLVVATWGKTFLFLLLERNFFISNFWDRWVEITEAWQLVMTTETTISAVSLLRTTKLPDGDWWSNLNQ